jgi:hypothetical protein
MHTRREHSGHNFCAHIVQRLRENAHRVARGRGGCVLGATVLVAGEGQDHAFAGKDGLVFALLPSIQEPLDPKDTIR